MIQYRKFQNGVEFMKIIDNRLMITVWNHARFNRVLVTKSQIAIEEATGSALSMESTKEEFDKQLTVAKKTIDFVNICGEETMANAPTDSEGEE